MRVPHPRRRLLGIAAPMALAATFAWPSAAHADIVLVNQTVNVPGTPVVETIQAACAQNSPGTVTIGVTLNGAPAAAVTVPWPPTVNPPACNTGPVTIGTAAQTDTILAYIHQPFGTVCAIAIGGACEVVYPFNPMTDTLVVQTCQGTTCSTRSTDLSQVFGLYNTLFGGILPLPTLPTINIP